MTHPSPGIKNSLVLFFHCTWISAHQDSSLPYDPSRYVLRGTDLYSVSVTVSLHLIVFFINRLFTVSTLDFSNLYAFLMWRIWILDFFTILFSGFFGVSFLISTGCLVDSASVVLFLSIITCFFSSFNLFPLSSNWSWPVYNPFSNLLLPADFWLADALPSWFCLKASEIAEFSVQTSDGNSGRVDSATFPLFLLFFLGATIVFPHGQAPEMQAILLSNNKCCRTRINSEAL